MFKVTSRTKIDFVNVFQVNPYHATILYIYPFKTSEHPWLTFWCGNIQYINLVLSANIYLFIVNNRNIRKRCEICSKFTKKCTRTTSMSLTPSHRPFFKLWFFCKWGHFFTWFIIFHMINVYKSSAAKQTNKGDMS